LVITYALSIVVALAIGQQSTAPPVHKLQNRGLDQEAAPTLRDQVGLTQIEAPLPIQLTVRICA
jgi:hypothetical protein